MYMNHMCFIGARKGLVQYFANLTCGLREFKGLSNDWLTNFFGNVLGDFTCWFIIEDWLEGVNGIEGLSPGFACGLKILAISSIVVWNVIRSTHKQHMYLLK